MVFPPKKDAKKGEKKPNPFAKTSKLPMKGAMPMKGSMPHMSKGGTSMKKMKGC